MEKKRKIRCRVKKCFNSTINGSAPAFFMFPKDKEQRNLWAQVLGVDVADVKKESVVCSDHFLNEDISVRDGEYILDKGSVPYPHTRCSAFGCLNYDHEGSPFKFWPFPRLQNNICQTWKLFTQRNNFQPSLSSTLCSAHFSFHQYNGKYLKFDAVPDIPFFTDYEHDATIEDVNTIELVTEVLPSNYEVSTPVSYVAEPLISDDVEFPEHLQTTIEDVNTIELVTEVLPSNYEVSTPFSYVAEPLISDDVEFPEHLKTTIEDVEMQVYPFNPEDIMEKSMKNRRKKLFETPTKGRLRRKIKVLQQKLRCEKSPQKSHFETSFSMEKRKIVRCRVKNCFNSTINGSAPEFFRLPKDKEVRNLWEQALGLDAGRKKIGTFVCSDHFLKKDITVIDSRYILNYGAVPYPHMRCSALGCYNFNDGGSPFKFWTFPNSRNISEKWELFTQRKNFKPSHSSTLCSAHFSFHQCNGEHLKFDAVPDIPLFTDIEPKNTIESIEVVSEVLPSNQEVSGPVRGAAFEHLGTASKEVRSIEVVSEVLPSNHEVSAPVRSDESVISDDAELEHSEISIEDVKSIKIEPEVLSNYEVCGIYNYGAESVISDHAEFLKTSFENFEADPLNSEDTTENLMENRRFQIPSKERLVNIDLRRKIRVLQQKVRRQECKIKSMKDLISVLKKEAKSQNNMLDILMSHLEEVPSEFVLANEKNKKKKKKKKAYQEDSD